MSLRHHIQQLTLVKNRLHHLLLFLIFLLLYKAGAAHSLSQEKSKKDRPKKEDSFSHTNGICLCHGFFVPKTISVFFVLGTAAVPRSPAISEIVIFHSNGQENKEDPDFSTFRYMQLHLVKSCIRSYRS